MHGRTLTRPSVLQWLPVARRTSVTPCSETRAQLTPPRAASRRVRNPAPGSRRPRSASIADMHFSLPQDSSSLLPSVVRRVDRAPPLLRRVPGAKDSFHLPFGLQGSPALDARRSSTRSASRRCSPTRSSRPRTARTRRMASRSSRSTSVRRDVLPAVASA